MEEIGDLKFEKKKIRNVLESKVSWMSDLKDDNPLLALPENFISFVKSNEFLAFLESIYIYCYVKHFFVNFCNVSRNF